MNYLGYISGGFCGGLGGGLDDLVIGKGLELIKC